MAVCGVILDVDGTLVDSNDAHAKAWVEAMTEHGFEVPFERIRPLVGMGGDKLLPEAIGVGGESKQGKAIDSLRSEIFREKYLPDIEAFPGVRELLKHMHDRGVKLVVASSAREVEMNPLLERAGADGFIASKTSTDDAENSKPAPDIVQAALEGLDCPPESVIMLGDTPYDVEAAKRAGIRLIGLRCGGWDAEGLKGAVAVYDDPATLLERYDTSPLAR